MVICLLTQRKLRFLSSLQSPPLQKHQQPKAAEVGQFRQKIWDSLTMRMFLNAVLALKSTQFKNQVIIKLLIDFCGSQGHQHSPKCDHKLHLCFFACLQSCIGAGRAQSAQVPRQLVDMTSSLAPSPALRS